MLKILWTILILTSFSVGFYNIADLTDGFYKYEVITNVKRITEKNFTFPAITICANGLMKRSYFKNDSFIESKYDNFYDNLSMRNFFLEGGFRNEALDKKLEYFKIPQYEFICIRYNGATNQQLININRTNERLYFLLNSTYTQTIEENGYINVYKYFDVSFYAYVEDNYLNWFSLNCLILKTGKGNWCTIIKAETEEKLAEPYSNCKNLTSNKRYQQMNCIESCIFKKMGNIFNCTLDGLFKIHGLKECPKRDYYFTVKKEFSEDCENECPQSCESLKFSSQLAQFDYTDYDVALLNNETMINLLVSDLSSLKISQIPKKTTFEFVSADIGGALGLFMGISFLNLIELFEFIAEISLSIVRI